MEKEGEEGGGSSREIERREKVDGRKWKKTGRKRKRRRGGKWRERKVRQETT